MVLDVGCGTGDLVCDLAKNEINARGVDFAQEMIDIAKDNAHKMGLEKAKFECCSFSIMILMKINLMLYLQIDLFSIFHMNNLINFWNFHQKL